MRIRVPDEYKDDIEELMDEFGYATKRQFVEDAVSIRIEQLRYRLQLQQSDERNG